MIPHLLQLSVAVLPLSHVRQILIDSADTAFNQLRLQVGGGATDGCLCLLGGGKMSKVLVHL